jgi:ribosome-binding protein aMBF1 (putative translation factor)
MANLSECELCGKSVSVLKKAKIEGTVMEVCSNCTSLGQQLNPPRALFAREQHLPKADEELVQSLQERPGT